jgi:hypothetical protein
MPKALAVPKPVKGDGLALMPMGRLSKVQAVRVFAAFAPDSEASSTETIQTMFFIFILTLVGVCQFLLINSLELHFLHRGLSIIRLQANGVDVTIRLQNNTNKPVLFMSQIRNVSDIKS